MKAKNSILNLKDGLWLSCSPHFLLVSSLTNLSALPEWLGVTEMVSASSHAPPLPPSSVLRLVSSQLLFCPSERGRGHHADQVSFLAPSLAPDYPFLNDLKETRNVKVLFFAFWAGRGLYPPKRSAEIEKRPRRLDWIKVQFLRGIKASRCLSLLD